MADEYVYRDKRKKPRCLACDKHFVPHGDVWACRECGEIHVRIEVPPPSPEANNDGWGTTGTKAFRPKRGTVAKAKIADAKKRKSKQESYAQGQMNYD